MSNAQFSWNSCFMVARNNGSVMFVVAFVELAVLYEKLRKRSACFDAIVAMSFGFE